MPRMALAAEGPGVAGAIQRAGSVDFSDRAFTEATLPNRHRFTVGERVFWRARFAEPPHAVRIDLITIRCSDPAWEHVVSGHRLWLAHPMTPGYAGWIGPGAYDRPGGYKLRFVRGDRVLAEGSFELVGRVEEHLVH
jgi:hypothetical protein